MTTNYYCNHCRHLVEIFDSWDPRCAECNSDDLVEVDVTYEVAGEYDHYADYDNEDEAIKCYKLFKQVDDTVKITKTILDLTSGCTLEEEDI